MSWERGRCSGVSSEERPEDESLCLCRAHGAVPVLPTAAATTPQPRDFLIPGSFINHSGLF